MTFIDPAKPRVYITITLLSFPLPTKLSDSTGVNGLHVICQFIGCIVIYGYKRENNKTVPLKYRVVPRFTTAHTREFNIIKF